jgi:biopolymer transport protein ExbD
MARDRRRQKLDEDSFDRIDVVPLLDLAFNLLIVFMICMPALESRLKLPTTGEVLGHKEPKEVLIGYNRDGQFTIDNVEVTEQGLVDRVKSMADQPDLNFVIKCDGSRSVDDLTHLYGLMKGAGVKKLSIATKKKSAN